MSWQSEELERSQRMQGDEKRERFEIHRENVQTLQEGEKKWKTKTRIKIVDKSIHFYILGVI